MALLEIAQWLGAFGAIEPRGDGDCIGKWPILNCVQGVVMNEVFDGVLGGEPMRHMMDCIVDVESLKGRGILR